MRKFIEALCSHACAGREVASPGSFAARQLIVDALKNMGLVPTLQTIPGSEGTNVLAEVHGTSDRWVVVAAHYDHLGHHGDDLYCGADDNAAGVAILNELGQQLKLHPPVGRNVLLAFFDAEEPPHFLSRSMGSAHFVSHPTVPLEKIDLMVCMDLVGHALGPTSAPPELRNTVFALGAERSVGTREWVDRLAGSTAGVVIRRADAEAVPPLSDYAAFWKKQVPFLFLSCGRWEHYHRPTDTPDRLDYDKIAATARWLEGFVRAMCARPEERFTFTESRDDRSTLESLLALLLPMSNASAPAKDAMAKVGRLLSHCHDDGTLDEPHRTFALALANQLEAMLSAST
ncbi:MAG: M28 family peptidase [Myxococcaceae bacterium]|nr:M28 family peptidase [Myxococcaceae bacterium]